MRVSSISEVKAWAAPKRSATKQETKYVLPARLSAHHPRRSARRVGRPIGEGRRRVRGARSKQMLPTPRQFELINLSGRKRRQLSRRSPTERAPGTRWTLFAGLRRARRRIDDHRAVRGTNNNRLGIRRQACGVDQGKSAHQGMRGHREGDHEQQERSQSCTAAPHVACIVHSGRESYGRNTTVGANLSRK